MREFSLEGRVALITGASRGIGAGIAKAFVESGASVALVARTSADVESFAAELRAGGARAIALSADVRDLDELPALVDKTVAELGALDVLVNNAGGEVSPPFLETRVPHLEEAFHFNVSVAFELSRLAVPYLLRRSGASIINVGSIVVGRSVRGHLAHHTAKAAQAQLTISLAADLGPKIRVNAILPGAVETDALRRYFELKADLRSQIEASTRMRRVGTPHDVALAAVFLASPASSWMTAKLIELDGGPIDGLMEYEPDL